MSKLIIFHIIQPFFLCDLFVFSLGQVPAASRALFSLPWRSDLKERREEQKGFHFLLFLSWVLGLLRQQPLRVSILEISLSLCLFPFASSSASAVLPFGCACTVMQDCFFLHSYPCISGCCSLLLLQTSSGF